MSDKPKIVAGLTLFLALVAFPVWYTLGGESEVAAPELEYPSEADACVEDTEYMTANHMDLLNQWRNAVVREGQREYVATSGERYVMSLTGTCLDCHTSRDEFCTRCHDYANVEPKCWDCHVDPGETE
jgi:hypothetical protein